MSTHICEHCNTSFTPGPGARGRFCSKPCQYAAMALINRQTGEARRSAKPIKHCTQCNNPITSTYGKLYCSRSCSAKASNAARGPMPLERKQHRSILLKEKTRPDISKGFHNISLKRMKKLFVVGPYTPIYKNKCIKTNKIFYSKSYQKYHPTIIKDRQHYAYLCKFKFSISEFPKWFDGRLIKDHGWYSTPGSRKGLRNLNGVSRDHLVSIDYGFRHNIPPAIISHPANCKLVLHKDNQRKRASCAISVKELMLRTSQFNTLYTDWRDR